MDDLLSLEISLEELANLTGLPRETIRQDKIDDYFRFSWRKNLSKVLDYFIPDFLKPYRYLIYTGLAAIFVIFVIQIFLAFFLLAIAIPAVILLLWILFLLPSENAKRLDFTIKAETQLDSKQQTALKNLIHQAQDYNLLVRDLRRVNSTIPTNRSSDQIDRDIAISTFHLCRNTILQALTVELQLRNELMSAKTDWIKKIMPILGEELEAKRIGINQDSSEPMIVSSMILLRQMQGKRDSLRETFEDTVFEQTVQQQIEQARVGRYGRMINQVLQIIQMVRREVLVLLSD
ncbi:MAG: hypothetical protein DCF20_11905 [Pseudanabaena sp.]|nr:MAG: hypothetical protein DCF20_11905 [Pseudanabaena sp.]